MRYDILYPLHADEVYLPECHDNDVTVLSVVCLRFNSSTDLQLTMTDESGDSMSWINTSFSVRADLQDHAPEGMFTCSSDVGHTVTAFIAGGELFTFV